MVAVYRVVPDCSKYQYFLAQDPLLTKWSFDGSRIGDKWEPPEVYIPYPSLQVGDFAGCIMPESMFACRPQVDALIYRFLEESGETLPLRHEDEEEEWLLFNATYVYNCLDKTRSVKHRYLPGEFEKYAFHPQRLGLSLFKIPETKRTELLCLEGIAAPGDEFKPTVEKNGLTGLRFDLLWRDNA